jgi:hypothetical protein
MSTSIPIKITKIDYRVIALILGIFVGMLVYDYKYEDYVNNNFTLADVVIILAPFAGGIMSVIVARRYWSSAILGKTYLALGIGLLFYFIANVIYEYISDFVVPPPVPAPFPSIADAFWVSMYPFFYYLLIVNITHFKKTLNRRHIIWMALIIGATTGTFLYTSLAQKPPLDFAYFLGLYYVIVDAGLLALAILGVMIFRSSILGKVWLLLVIGFLIYSFADYWYYDYLTMFTDQYSDSHPVNMVWVLAFMVMTYALYKHKKIL